MAKTVMIGSARIDESVCHTVPGGANYCIGNYEAYMNGSADPEGNGLPFCLMSNYQQMTFESDEWNGDHKIKIEKRAVVIGTLIPEYLIPGFETYQDGTVGTLKAEVYTDDSGKKRLYMWIEPDPES